MVRQSLLLCVMMLTNLHREIKMMHKAIVGVCFALLVIGQTGCSNSHKQASRAAADASKAEADVSKQKSEILEDYRKCLKDNPSDEKACEGYNGALESM